MWRLRTAIRLVERLLERHRAELAELNIDDDVQMALQPLRRAVAKVRSKAQVDMTHNHAVDKTA
jgi:hypothetical protein